MSPSDELQNMVTRFAPSPTGRLHIGHGWSALMAHDMARAAGGAFRLRIEDIDGTRSRPEHVAGILEDLRWLGIDWDGDAVMHQSQRLDVYAAALDRLKGEGLVYPCFCTRAEIAAEIAASASAPHGPEGALYPGTCRALSPAQRAERAAQEPHCWRLDMAAALARSGPIRWRDAEQGWIDAHPEQAGDVVLARKDAPTSYHLAATTDDAAMGVTHVLRGEDLRTATDIHALLQTLLGLPGPVYRHHPLLVDASGRRLAKRTGGITLAELRESGADPACLAADLRSGVFPVGISLQHA
ncbi:tRNA glutamyl-Q(34) synthetase GluQRS [Sphingobium subterraneum]|uniref:Glutamyl-Q tRNA(Asp) synthetase n=1 Tax=Sphingobium subterraneum TaxID=627688 RepID=A0A841J5W5_9SPHN|nr:tRNA glutamyl-Q(34) synthetase GluQRS [Sphingobium subterraneum]MBB6123918.1 glutamyl-Q tRNA(Asp) synthetase [Sphingobium subterraneum]